VLKSSAKGFDSLQASDQIYAFIGRDDDIVVACKPVVVYLQSSPVRYAVYDRRLVVNRRYFYIPIK
jgi:hypothetical protein